METLRKHPGGEF